MVASDSPNGDAPANASSDARSLRRTPNDSPLSNRIVFIAAFLWGLAEALFFFIVPDVLLTWIATRSLRLSIQASLVALAGALVGGAAVVAFASGSPDTAHALLLHIPGINAHLLERVSGQVDELNLLAILFGPLKGIPYKIYAVEWGTRGGALLPFLLISVPARWVRFALSALLARVIAYWLAPLTQRRARLETLILATIWIAFYIFYFTRFGW